MSKRLTLDFCQELARKHGGKCLSTTYYNNSTKLEWECSRGHRWCAIVASINNTGTWCPFCSGRPPRDLQYCKDMAKKRGWICLSSEYKNARTKMPWRCGYGHIFDNSLDNLDNKKQGCPYCSNRTMHTVEWAQELAESRGGKFKSDSFSGVRFKYEWECCMGHSWEATANSIEGGTWCPFCAHQNSRKEKEVYEFVKSLYPDALNNRRGLLKTRNFELDIYVPSKKKAIEFDGFRWHKSEWAINRGSIERDNRKNSECIEHGIELMRIDELFYDKNKEIVFKSIELFLSTPTSPAIASTKTSEPQPEAWRPNRQSPERPERLRRTSHPSKALQAHPT